MPYDVPGFTQPDSERPPIGDSGVIGPLDTISVQVYQLPDLSRDIQVDRDGRIAMPLIGSVDATGLTAPQLAERISTRLAANYVRSPSVTVAIKQAIAKQVTIEGSVKRPGVYELRGQTTLLGAVAIAGGPDEYANVHRVVVFRQIDGKRNAAAFDLATIRNGETPDPVIYGNDTVVMDGSGFTKAYRDFLNAVPLLSLFRVF